ncbi:MAG: FTR1 family protein, partial [Clostridia bacterium]|nr:FTR1 family protein [Clostridia bacterium]
MKSIARFLALALALLLALCSFAIADEAFQFETGNRWGSSADRIDQYLDMAFENYLAGENSAAYDCVNNAYFKVYEVTGFERQTMTYVSGPRKNAVELEFTTCKAMVKKTETDEETKAAVRGELNKLKSMIREDANKLAAKDGEPQTEMSYWQNGVRVDVDPWSELAGEGGGVRYSSWAEAYEAVSDMVSTVATEYRGRAYADAADTFDNMYFSVYWASGFAGQIYSEFGYDQWKMSDNQFMSMREILVSGKYQSTAFGNAQKKLLSGLKARAARLDRAADIAKLESGKTYTNWANAFEDYETLSQTALDALAKGDPDGLLSRSVEAAYNTVWIKSGFRDRVVSEVGAQDAAKIDEGFAALRKSVDAGNLEQAADSAASMEAVLNETGAALKSAAAKLDEIDRAAETRNLNWATALGSFGIIVREGLEAILVIAGIIAYLTKSGNRKALKHVYIGAIAGIVASFIAAGVLYFVKKAFTAAGIAQELIVGVTALIAVCVLFYVSNWMISKSEAAAWTGYLNDKVQSSVEKRSSFTLAFTAFLSVFREGAEVVLFYQPMMSG